MADKTLSELPEALELYDDSLLLVEQQGQAQNIRGKRVGAFAENALTKFIQGAGYLLTVGKVTTGAAGSDAKVTNSGTAQKPVLEFTIPRGATGAKGDKGEKGGEGPTGPQGADGVSPTVAVSKSGTVTTVTITDASGAHKATINDGAKGEKGDTGGVTGVKGNAETGGYRTGNVNLTAENIGTYDKSKIDSLLSSLTSGGSYHGNIDDLKGGNKIYWCNVTSAWTPPTSGTLPPNMSYFWLAVLSQSGSDCIQIAFAASEVKFFCVRTWINNRWYDWNRYIALQDGKVQTENLADSAVTGAKINDGAVSQAKLANGAVTRSKIAAGALPNAIAITSGQDLNDLTAPGIYSSATSSISSSLANCPHDSGGFTMYVSNTTVNSAVTAIQLLITPGGLIYSRGHSSSVWNDWRMTTTTAATNDPGLDEGPTIFDQVRADVDYIAAMTGVEL